VSATVLFLERCLTCVLSASQTTRHFSSPLRPRTVARSPYFRDGVFLAREVLIPFDPSFAFGFSSLLFFALSALAPLLPKTGPHPILHACALAAQSRGVFLFVVRTSWLTEIPNERLRCSFLSASSAGPLMTAFRILRFSLPLRVQFFTLRAVSHLSMPGGEGYFSSALSEGEFAPELAIILYLRCPQALRRRELQQAFSSICVKSQTWCCLEAAVPIIPGYGDPPSRGLSGRSRCAYFFFCPLWL